MAASKNILRIRRTDVDAHDEATPCYALVSVEHVGPQPLDVKLVGTEGENVFAASIRQSQIKNFREHKNTGDDHEWEAVLRSTLLLQDPAVGDDAKPPENVEIVASVSDQQLNIKVRKNTEGIIQQLGKIPLAEDSGTEIEFFEWTAIAVSAASAAREESRDLQNKYEAQQLIIDKLKSQLDDLIQAKQDHESALLAKFQELLNAKKLKIRDQQRLLAGAKVDPAAAVAVEHARGTTRRNQPRKAAPSRANKRKANEKTPVVDSESDIGEASRMQVDDDDAGTKQEEEEELAEAATPEKSDLDETEDEDDEGFNNAVPASQPTKTGVGAKGKAVETATRGQSSQREKSPEELPPRRELPFAKKQSMQQSTKKAVEKPSVTALQSNEDDETTDDDEL